VNRIENRPLILVGHSLGGLLIKQALVLAAANDFFKNLRLATYVHVTVRVQVSRFQL
jgi:predicted alpha/beta hydrolase family esterase